MRISDWSSDVCSSDLRYIVSASARFDQSNLFGVKANQKGVPLYSLGLSWILNKEGFYDLGWLPFMKIRATYGKSGNVNKSLSAFTTARFVSSSAIGLHNARVKNPPKDRKSVVEGKSM